MKGLARLAKLSQEVETAYRHKIDVWYSVQKDHATDYKKDDTYYHLTYLIRPCTTAEIEKAIRYILSL